MLRDRRTLALLSFVLLAPFYGMAAGAIQESKPPISLDEFMNATDLQGAKLSPDGSAALITTTSPDWQQNRFRSDLWIWRQSTGDTVPLTHSGHARSPQWSPDGRYIAFLSDMGSGADQKNDADSKDSSDRLWLISAEGGESFPLYKEDLDVHAFTWSADGSQIFFSTTPPLAKKAEEERKAQWKDVIRWREQERGDLLLALPVAESIKAFEQDKSAHAAADDPSQLPKLAKTITTSGDAIKAITAAPGGTQIAFVTDSVSHRQEDPAHNEIYLVSTAAGSTARRLTNNQALESDLQWSPDSKQLYFRVGADAGAVEGAYRDLQGRVYALDPTSGQARRMGGSFDGSFEGYTVMSDGRVIASGLKGTQQQLYQLSDGQAVQLPGLPGTYGGADASRHGTSLVVKYSTVVQPTQIVLVTDAAHLEQGKVLTHFNVLFTERAQAERKPYQWKADDGTTVEGMLIYPPHSMGQKHLRMLTLIHGGPADADIDRFGADWYDWANLAAANGWLVFRPNYRGSTGYGDKFILQIAPHLVSRPGKDILEGVDALVKDGIADPDQLAIGGYSYGGYMTNWLITQTTRFRAAVTGAGTVEHAANWGNDDTSYDDVWYLGGALPWQNPAIYQSEGALFQMDKVRTPTHIVGGNADVRVSFLEDVLLERALQQLRVPHSLLVFPGEGHPLDKNPWHGYIKVREELQWLEKYTKKP